MTCGEVWVFGGSAFAAAVVQSTSSFGFGVVCVALMPIFGAPLADVVVLVTLLVTVNLAIALWRLRAHVRWRPVAWVLVGVPFGLPVGLYLLGHGPEWALRALLGGVLVFMAVEPFFRRNRPPAAGHRGWAVATGVISGVLGGALSTGGPPIVIYFYRMRWSKELTKAAVLLAFVGTVTFRLVAYVPAGMYNAYRLEAAAFALPAVVAGTLVGEWLFGAVSQEGFRRAVAAMLVVCGLYQIGRGAGLW
ncbi:sulfite exporter TauE/SafE family protein [bacterium]|nr:sulfite exporter TauE/SafE family protein [bacterium]